MIRNVREHSNSSYGAVVCAQYYSGKNVGRPYVSVGVADTGIGVRKSLLGNYPELGDDRGALLKAIQPGVTGATSTMYGHSNNAGAGLFYTRRLAEVSEQYFAIGSGSLMFRTSRAKRRPADDALTFSVAPYPGTMVSVNFALEREVEFDDFLRVTGQEFTKLDEQLRDQVDRRVRFV